MTSVDRTIVCGPFIADCTDPPYCVQVAKMSDGTIRITSSIPDHDGEIFLGRDDFDEMSRIIAAADPLEIFVFRSTDPVNIIQREEETFLVGPDGKGGETRILFYHAELLSFFRGIRHGEFADKLQLTAA